MTPPIAAITAVHRIRLKWTVNRVWACITLCGIGAGFAFGPERYHAARGYQVAGRYLDHQLHIGWHGAGGFFLAAAAAILTTELLGQRTGSRRMAHGIAHARIAANVTAAFLYLLFAYSLFLAWLDGSLDGFPALFLWPLAASVHLDASAQLARGLREDR